MGYQPMSFPWHGFPTHVSRYSATFGGTPPNQQERSVNTSAPKGRHHMRKFLQFTCCVLLIFPVIVRADPLPNTTPLTANGDLGLQMVDGIDRWLTRETAAAL